MAKGAQQVRSLVGNISGEMTRSEIMASLSPAQVSHLLYTEWDHPDVAVWLNGYLVLFEVETS